MLAAKCLEVLLCSDRGNLTLDYTAQDLLGYEVSTLTIIVDIFTSLRMHERTGGFPLQKGSSDIYESFTCISSGVDFIGSKAECISPLPTLWENREGERTIAE